MDAVNERSTAYVTFAFKDKAGAAAAPTSVTYSLTDVTNGRRLRDGVSLTPAASVEITLTAEDNALLRPGVSEVRRVNIDASYGAGDEYHGVYLYTITDLEGLV